MRKRLSVNETKKFYDEKNVRQTGADEGLFCRILLLILGGVCLISRLTLF